MIDEAIGEVLKKRESAILKSVADIVKSHAKKEIAAAIREVIERVTPPNVTVSPRIPLNIPTPNVTVEVDMRPVAEAIAAMGETIRLLVETLHKPAEPREPRKITITHDDGSTSIVKEE